MFKNVSINVLISRYFLFWYRSERIKLGLNLSPQASIKMAKTEEKIVNFNDIFRTFPKLEMFLESPFLGDLKNGTTIEFSYRNDGEN